MNTSELDRYCLVIRRPLRYGVVYVGLWPDLLRQIEVQKARGVDLETLRAIPFTENRRINQEQASRAFRASIPDRLTCTECGSAVVSVDTEGACICEENHSSWVSSTPEWQAISQRGKRASPTLASSRPNKLRRLSLAGASRKAVTA